jgi:hypothetical protein
MHKRVIVFFALVSVTSFLIASCSSHIVLAASENGGNRESIQQSLIDKVEIAKMLEKLIAQMQRGIEAIMNMMDGIHKTPQLPS